MFTKMLLSNVLHYSKIALYQCKGRYMSAVILEERLQFSSLRKISDCLEFIVAKDTAQEGLFFTNRSNCTSSVLI